MKTVTIRNIPDAVYEKLKELAEINRRSINSEFIHQLEKSVKPMRIDLDADSYLAELRRFREPMMDRDFSQKEIKSLNGEDKP